MAEGELLLHRLTKLPVATAWVAGWLELPRPTLKRLLQVAPYMQGWAVQQSMHDLRVMRSYVRFLHASSYHCMLRAARVKLTTRCPHCSADTSTGKLLGTAALIIERKFIHSCGKVRCRDACSALTHV